MAKAKPGPQEASDDSANEDKQACGFQAAEERASADALSTGEHHPIKVLLDLATDDNVENQDGVEHKVDNVRAASGNALLTKSELQKYDDYKKQWAAALARPQESLEALARREQQIIEAAANHDWEALDRLKKEVDADVERMKYIFASIATDLTEL
jgi:hypothetical protein